MIIDGKNLVLGRVATVAAKKALLGEQVAIVNCRDIAVTGTKAYLMRENLRKRKMGTPAKGPFVIRMPDRYVKRAIKRMLPYKKPRGREAFKRIMCYNSVPEKLKTEKAFPVKGAEVSKVPNMKYMTVGEICRLLGGKI